MLDLHVQHTTEDLQMAFAKFCSLLNPKDNTDARAIALLETVEKAFEVMCTPEKRDRVNEVCVQVLPPPPSRPVPAAALAPPRRTLLANCPAFVSTALPLCPLPCLVSTAPPCVTVGRHCCRQARDRVEHDLKAKNKVRIKAGDLLIPLAGPEVEQLVAKVLPPRPRPATHTERERCVGQNAAAADGLRVSAVVHMIDCPPLSNRAGFVRSQMRYKLLAELDERFKRVELTQQRNKVIGAITITIGGSL